MNQVANDILRYYSGTFFDALDALEEDIIMHFGVGKDDGAPGRGSGRYEKGSGEEAYQHAGDFVTRVKRLRKEHPDLSKNDIAILAGCKNDNELRTRYTQDLNAHRLERNSKIQSMLDEGKTQQAIADYFGVNESTLRSWMKASSKARVNRSQETIDFLKEQVDKKGMIDVGAGVERELHCSKERLKAALTALENEGYQVFGGRVPQATNPGQMTTVKCLATNEFSQKDIYQHPEKIQSVADYVLRETLDGDISFQKKWEYPAAIDPKRVLVRYYGDICPDGKPAQDRDGTIEIRRNVPDLDLQGSHYAQVRIMTQDNRYLKGVALYSDDIPDGYDVVFNSSKPQGRWDLALKPIKSDPDDPFGALLKEKGGQYKYTDKDGNEKLGLINKTREEGDWEDWDDTLPSQFLAKQPMALITKQLGLSISQRKAEYEDILSLTNPTVKKKFFMDFAESCDADAVDMHAASLPRQKYQLLLPVPTMPDNEVYAPQFKDGETIALIRYPHGGLFEIPILKVNNKNPDARKLLGPNPKDAIGINKNNLDRLSGADCDGDTVMCIPCNDPRFSSTLIENLPQLEGLEGFDNKLVYGYDTEPVTTYKTVTDKSGNTKQVATTHYYRNGKEFKTMPKSSVQREMGMISNLIMDMTIKGAPLDELAMAVRHSMVVVDAEKHHLDYKASEKDNHIKMLKEKYQAHDYDEEDDKWHYGASTLLTRAKSPTRVPKPKGTPKIDPETGKLYYTDSQKTPQTFTGKDGKEHFRTEEVNLLDTKEDAFELVSSYSGDRAAAYTASPKEAAYALYSNELRAMANEARKEYMATNDIRKNPSAAALYKKEADRLTHEVVLAEMNAPRERMAQYYARSVSLAKEEENPEMSKKDKKKARNKALVNGRLLYGAKRHTIDISPREWEAIQAGAISSTTLESVLKYADQDQILEYAMPKKANKLTSGQEHRIQSMLAKGLTSSEIAEAMNISESTVNTYKEKK